MARGKQFTQLISDLRAELGRNNDPGVRASDLAQLQQTLSQVYEQLYAAYDWPHLREVFPRIALSAGQRYYDFPDDMDFDRMEKVVVWYNSQPASIKHGIGFEDYATYDSETDDRGDPVFKWDVRWVSTKEQIEVWPIPAGNDQALQFIGIKKFVDLVDDSDKCRLDDNFVVLTAAQRLDTDKNRIAARNIALIRLEGTLKGRAKSGAETYRMGLGQANPPNNGRAVVRIAGA